MVEWIHAAAIGGMLEQIVVAVIFVALLFVVIGSNAR